MLIQKFFMSFKILIDSEMHGCASDIALQMVISLSALVGLETHLAIYKTAAGQVKTLAY